MYQMTDEQMAIAEEMGMLKVLTSITRRLDKYPGHREVTVMDHALDEDFDDGTVGEHTEYLIGLKWKKDGYLMMCMDGEIRVRENLRYYYSASAVRKDLMTACSDRRKILEKNDAGTRRIEILYADYKKSYRYFDTEKDSYDETMRSIEVIIPKVSKTEEKLIDEYIKREWNILSSVSGPPKLSIPYIEGEALNCDDQVRSNKNVKKIEIPYTLYKHKLSKMDFCRFVWDSERYNSAGKAISIKVIIPEDFEITEKMLEEAELAEVKAEEKARRKEEEFQANHHLEDVNYGRYKDYFENKIGYRAVPNSYDHRTKCIKVWVPNGETCEDLEAKRKEEKFLASHHLEAILYSRWKNDMKGRRDYKDYREKEDSYDERSKTIQVWVPNDTTEVTKQSERRIEINKQLYDNGEAFLVPDTIDVDSVEVHIPEELMNA